MVRPVKLGKLQVLALGGLLIGAVPAAATEYPSLDPVRGVVTMAPLLERTTPAVVNVSVESRQAADTNPLFADPFFRRFFDAPPQSRERRTVSAGSGVIVDARRGLILTNHHVVADADRITVNLKDGRDFAAELVGSDPATDVALLRIAGQKLTELAFGDFSRLEVGDLVIAIGNPFGLGQTVTSGIVSALGRSGIVRGNYEDFIQTDAAINPGNSGGALINSKGELIGINSAILSQGGGNVGIGFAVPANMARSVMDQLLRFGAVRRGQIGVALQDLTAKQVAAQGLGAQGGALIARVEPGSPAARAGLRQGDIVLAVEGSPVRSSTELRNRHSLGRDRQQRDPGNPARGSPQPAEGRPRGGAARGREHRTPGTGGGDSGRDPTQPSGLRPDRRRAGDTGHPRQRGSAGGPAPRRPDHRDRWRADRLAGGTGRRAFAGAGSPDRQSAAWRHPAGAGHRLSGRAATGLSRAGRGSTSAPISTGCPGLLGLRGAAAQPVEPDPAHTGEGN